jgi:hypothetical protein
MNTVLGKIYKHKNGGLVSVKRDDGTSNIIQCFLEPRRKVETKGFMELTRMDWVIVTSRDSLIEITDDELKTEWENETKKLEEELKNEMNHA